MTQSTPPKPLLLPHISDLDISPSKARAAHTTSLAWSQITFWLVTLFSPNPVPVFERNAETLAYLQELMHANLRADERKKVISEAEREQVGIYERWNEAMQRRPERTLLRDVNEALGEQGREMLRNLAKACVNLGYVPSGVEKGLDETTTELARRLQKLTVELFDLQNQVTEVEDLKQSFERELQVSREAAVELEQMLNGLGAESDLDLVRLQTAQHVRETKQIVEKTREYEKKITALSKQVEARQGVSVEDIRHREGRVQRRRDEVMELEKRLRQYHGLPPNVEASRDEVKRAQAELARWKRRTEELFESM